MILLGIRRKFKMFIRVSPAKIIRAATSRGSLFGVILIFALVLFVFLSLIVMVVDDRPSLMEAVKKDRTAPLETWNINKSLNIEDYIDYSNENSFLVQPYGVDRAIDNSTFYFCGPNITILILVTSAPSHFLARNAIRETWAKRQELENKGLRMAFVLGVPAQSNDTVEEELDAEIHKYGDIIQEDFVDTYHNLTLKSLAMLKWVNLTCPVVNGSDYPEFVLKTDDDMFININRLLKIARDAGPAAKMIGRLTCGAKPIDDENSKLYMPKYLFPGNIFPGYLSGTAYLLRTEIVASLLQNSLTTPLVHLEDVYITGILSRKIPTDPVDSIYFTYGKFKPEDKCPFRLMVNSHQMTPGELYRVMENMNKTIKCPTRRIKWLRRPTRMTKRLKRLCRFF